jgi:hypothetical protein
MAMAIDMHSPEMNSIHVYQSTCYPSRETISRRNLQLIALQKEIDRSEVMMGRNRMENVMRRPHFRLPIVLTRLNCVSPCVEVCHTTSIVMHNTLEAEGQYQLGLLVSRTLIRLASCLERTVYSDNLRDAMLSLPVGARMRSCDKV